MSAEEANRKARTAGNYHDEAYKVSEAIKLAVESGVFKTEVQVNYTYLFAIMRELKENGYIVERSIVNGYATDKIVIEW